jgi:hypothetical protein
MLNGNKVICKNDQSCQQALMSNVRNVTCVTPLACDNYKWDGASVREEMFTRRVVEAPSDEVLVMTENAGVGEYCDGNSWCTSANCTSNKVCAMIVAPQPEGSDCRVEASCASGLTCEIPLGGTQFKCVQSVAAVSAAPVPAPTVEALQALEEGSVGGEAVSLMNDLAMCAEVASCCSVVNSASVGNKSTSFKVEREGASIVFECGTDTIVSGFLNIHKAVTPYNYLVPQPTLIRRGGFETTDSTTLAAPSSRRLETIDSATSAGVLFERCMDSVNTTKLFAPSASVHSDSGNTLGTDSERVFGIGTPGSAHAHTPGIDTVLLLCTASVGSAWIRPTLVLFPYRLHRAPLHSPFTALLFIFHSLHSSSFVDSCGDITDSSNEATKAKLGGSTATSDLSYSRNALLVEFLKALDAEGKCPVPSPCESVWEYIASVG